MPFEEAVLQCCYNNGRRCWHGKGRRRVTLASRTEREGSEAESVESDRRWHFLKEANVLAPEHYLLQPNNSQPRKMAKRKRDDGTEGTPEKSPEPVADPKQKRLQLKLHQATVKLGHAFKVAKGFERQKLGRRQKTAAAAKNEKDAQRVETEIAALKVRE